MLSVWPFQATGISTARDRYRAGIRRLLFALPTGGGKTICAAEILRLALERGPAIFVAPWREVVDETHRKLVEECAFDAAQVAVLMANDRRCNSAAPLQVCSIHTLLARLDSRLPPARLIVFDECHRGLDAQLAIAKLYPDAWILGLSATPFASDGRSLGELYQDVVQVATIKELTPEYLAPARMKGVPRALLPHLQDVPLNKDGDYVEGKLEVACNRAKLVEGLVERWKQWGEDRSVLAFAVGVEHSKHIAARYQAAGIAVHHVDGGMAPNQRRDLIAAARGGAIRGLSACDCLGEGFDMKRAKVAQLARPTWSLKVYLQQIGRVLRSFDGLEALVLDHASNHARLGLYDDAHPVTLGVAPRRRKGQADPELAARTCEACYLIYRARLPACPSCGAASPTQPRRLPKEGPGEMVDITSTVPLDLRWRSTFTALCRAAAAKGHRPGWVAHVFKAKHGAFPPLEWGAADEIARAARRRNRGQA